MYEFVLIAVEILSALNPMQESSLMSEKTPRQMHRRKAGVSKAKFLFWLAFCIDWSFRSLSTERLFWFVQRNKHSYTIRIKL